MKQYELDNIPNWVKWIAQDASGAWWGYEVEPQEYDRGWYENELGRSIQLKSTSPNQEWQTTLTSLKSQKC